MGMYPSMMFFFRMFVPLSNLKVLRKEEQCKRLCVWPLQQPLGIPSIVQPLPEFIELAKMEYS